ncbi:MAG: septum formation initiator family protein [Desulfobacter sp.]|nr:septum formation initiator family protein [Desulfobacter sp.]WDP86697.1 MAG: septum formation initiator family protein [Desulfobacter sp.]
MTSLEKLCFYFGISLCLVLLGMIFFSTKGVMDYQALKKTEERIQIQAEFEAGQNRKIEKEIKSLKHDIEYIRHLAKHEHEMADPDEFIFKEKVKPKDALK